ncbi:MAG: lamin tail domain-containing protein, partial [Clostridiaceae bacterium]|nr:lamin tail domain-containing protein [Clostridiaceae bacterium]
MLIKKTKIRITSIILALVLLFSINGFNVLFAEEHQEHGVVINEVESNDPGGGKDWIELYNNSTGDVDISGWIISDDKGLARL